MSRILLTWELGLNLGHLARLLPLAQQLVADGHVVLVATRDIQSAARVLGPAGIPFVQAPHLPKGIALPHRASGYADILLSQGWSDEPTLRGLTLAWLNLLRLFKPERLVLDYSPTVSLAARIENIPTVSVGNGFELPPLTDPLPPFPLFSWATPDLAAKSEARAVANANRVLSTLHAPTLTALRELFERQTRLFATFAELDHYGARHGEGHYIGPLFGALRTRRIGWPEGTGPRIFACLRQDTASVQAILGALGALQARVLCVVPGFERRQLEPFARDHIRYVADPVDLEPLLDADVAVTYGAEGTILRFLTAGVPQVISPWHVETFMAARRIEAAGLGAFLPGTTDSQAVSDLIARVAGDTAMRRNVGEFAQRTRHVTESRALTSWFGTTTH